MAVKLVWPVFCFIYDGRRRNRRWSLLLFVWYLNPCFAQEFFLLMQFFCFYVLNAEAVNSEAKNISFFPFTAATHVCLFSFFVGNAFTKIVESNFCFYILYVYVTGGSNFPRPISFSQRKPFFYIIFYASPKGGEREYMRFDSPANSHVLALSVILCLAILRHN